MDCFSDFIWRYFVVAEKKKLGRGLEALLRRVDGTESNRFSEIIDFPASVDTDGGRQQQLPQPKANLIDVMLIDQNPFQPRQEFDEAELDQLAASLQEHGLLQPIVVRKVSSSSGERFQIIAGERRFRAAMRIGWSEVPVHCMTADDRRMIEIALTENIQRKDLNAIEKAVSFANYLEVYGGTHEELAKRLELDRSTVTNLLRLLELPQELQDAVKKGKLTQGHVRALLPLEEGEQIDVAVRIQSEGWSVRETERFVKELIENGGQPLSSTNGWNVIGQNGEARPTNSSSEHLIQLEQDFRQWLGGVKIKLTQSNEKGKGKLTISFSNHAEFERIYATICKSGKAAG
jgi:ParB family chromosome partitioning protein